MMDQETKIKKFDLLESRLAGTNLIEASAGTGKTYAITGLFLRLILEKRFSVNEILVVTYTVAATEELRDRIRKKLRETLEAFQVRQSQDAFIAGLLRKFPDTKAAVQSLREALHDFDEAPIFTIHGFCQRTLHENAFESGSLFDTELVPDPRSLEQEIVHDFCRMHIYNAPPEFVSYAQQKCSPKSLMTLVGKRTAHPDLEIIPRRDSSELESLGSLRAAFERLKSTWPSVKPEVLEKLSDKGLHKGKYRNPSQLVNEIDEELTAPRPGIPILRCFEKLTPAALAAGTTKKGTTPTHPFFDLCGDFKAKAEALQEEMNHQIFFLRREIFQYMKKELPVRKQKRNIQFFDDLLLRVETSLEKEGAGELARAIRSRYRAALIDEFQDTDPVQFAIFKSVFSGEESILFLIGDPKQAIFSFRGADLFAYMNASKDVQARYTLTTNWRSEPELIKATNAIFSRCENPFLYEDITFEPAVSEKRADQELLRIDGESDPLFHLWFVDPARVTGSDKKITKTRARRIIPRVVASEISRLLSLGRSGKARIGNRELREEDIAVLVRKNHEATYVQEALAGLNIPSVLHTTGNLFDTDDAGEMERVLTAIAEPYDEQLLRIALATDMIGVNGEELGGLMRDEAGWESWLSRFQGYHDSWERRGFIQMFRFLLLREKVRTRLLSLPNGERRLTNILHLSEVLHQEATEQKLGMVGLIKWLARQRDERSPRLEEHQLRLESDAHAVKLVTIHKSKGLEYPIVFCPFNWDGSRIGTRDTFTFHGRDGKLTLVLDAKENPNRALGEKELLAENLRLLYVSLTRARNRCYLVWGRFNEAETSSLAYILHSKDGDPDNIVSATGEHFGGLPDQEVRLDLVAISRNSGGAILFTDIPMAPGKKHSPPEERRDELTCRTFSAVLEKERHFASFSYLVARQAREAGLIEHSSVDLPDHDQNLGGEEGMPEEELSGIFAFPKGARPGVLLHDIFEHLDFTRSKNESVKPLVGDKLREYGFEAKWEDTVCDMVRKVLTVPLLQGRGNFTLSAITLRDRLSELEFYYPLKSITPAGLRQIFARHGGGDIPAEFPDRIEELNFLPAKGFMRGFIDLVFQFEGRFYIVDWKSNLLGSRIESYGREALAAEMEEKFYILQSHLYTVAVNQYLKVRVPGYDYEKHFGGVIYLFLRGIAPEHGSEFGVYRSVPNKELIEGLCENLIGRE